MIKLLIDEEYGYRTWVANLTEDEYQELLNRWNTMRGLICHVPVKLIIPQAEEVDDDNVNELDYVHRCHIHECDDSYITGSNYEIPKDEYFWMNGKKYELEEYWPNKY